MTVDDSASRVGKIYIFAFDCGAIVVDVAGEHIR